jgi:hypothetical protein
LTPTLRRQDHTTWPSASTPFVKGASASTASRSTYRDDREPPPWKERDRVSIIRKSEFVKSNSKNKKQTTHPRVPSNIATRVHITFQFAIGPSLAIPRAPNQDRARRAIVFSIGAALEVTPDDEFR